MLFVSYFIQLTRRNPATPTEIREMSMDTFLRHPRFGIAVMSRSMNSWYHGIRRPIRFHNRALRGFTRRAGASISRIAPCNWRDQIDENVFGPAIDFSDFRNMQKLEAAGGFRSKIMQPRDEKNWNHSKSGRARLAGSENTSQPKAELRPPGLRRAQSAQYRYSAATGTGERDLIPPDFASPGHPTRLGAPKIS